MAISIVENAVSRRQEYEADAFVGDTTGNVEPMITGLKKLSVENLSNVMPHPLKVLLSYSHPPVLDRIRALRTLEQASDEGAGRL